MQTEKRNYVVIYILISHVDFQKGACSILISGFVEHKSSKRQTSEPQC